MSKANGDSLDCLVGLIEGISQGEHTMTLQLPAQGGQ